MSAVSSKQRAGETPGQGLREGPSPTRGQGAQGIRAESSLKTPEPPSPVRLLPACTQPQVCAVSGSPWHSRPSAQPCLPPIPHPSLLPAPHLHWRSLPSIRFWKFLSHVHLPSHESTSVLLAGKMKTPLQGHLQTPLPQLSPDSDTGGLTWLVKCSIWEGVSII